MISIPKTTAHRPGIPVHGEVVGIPAQSPATGLFSIHRRGAPSYLQEEVVQIAERCAEAARMFQHGAGVDEIREALGYNDNKAVRAAIRKVLGSARRQEECCRPTSPKQEVRRRKRGDVDEELPVSILTSRDRRVHRLIEQHARRRHERLEGLLRASGLHIAQMTPAQLGNRVWSLEQYDG